MLRALILPLCLAVTGSLYGQKGANPEKAKSLKSLPHHKSSNIAGTSYSSAYSFELNDESISVSQQETLEMIALQGNTDYVRAIFYNDNIRIVSHEARYAKGKALPKINMCGNYEVESIFYSDAKVCSYKMNFLHEGTEINFSARMKYNDPKYLTKVFFHDDLSLEAREISFTVPPLINVELVEQNFAGYEIKKTVTKEQGKTVYRYTLKNLTAIKSESNSLGALHHYPHLIVLTKDYSLPGGKRFVLSSVDDLYKWYAGLVKEVKNDPTLLAEQVNKLIAKAKTPEEKIRAIYYWVQDNIKYIAFEDGIAGFKPEAAQNVYTNRYGDCKGMANLTCEMLKIANFDARLTWIGTNRIPYNYDIPSLAVDNHMICTVFAGDKQYILDPTEKYMPLGAHAERIQGKEMLIENGDTFIRKKVPLSDYTSNLVSRNEIMVIDGEILKGQGEVNLNGEAKKEILYISHNVKQEDRKKIFDRLAVLNYNNIDRVEIVNTPPLDREKSLQVKYTYALHNKVSRFDKDLYINFDWNKMYQDLQMKEDRESDYYFHAKVLNKTIKKLKVPAGYKVTHLPKGMSKKHADFSFEVSFKQVGNEILYTNEIIVHKGIIERPAFAVWNSYVKELKEIYGDQIVLTKTN